MSLITRRKFAAIAGLGMIKAFLTAGWAKPRALPSATVPAHVENRRLFGMAKGTLLLRMEERRHLHMCRVCQGVACVFIKQPLAS